MYAATGGSNVKWGGHRFQMVGPGTTAPPARDDPVEHAPLEPVAWIPFPIGDWKM